MGKGLRLLVITENLGLFSGPHGSSQLSMTPVPRALMPSFDLLGYEVCTWCTDIHVGKTLVHTHTHTKLFLKSWDKSKEVKYYKTLRN